VTKTRAIPIKPSTVVHVRGEAELRWVTWGERVLHFAQVTRATLLAMFFLVIASFIGVFTCRISQVNSVGVEPVMDAIFRESLPPIRAFVGAFISGAVCALVFYSHPHSSASRATENTKEADDKKETGDTKETQGTGRFIYFIAGVVTVVALDLLLFNLTSQDLVNLNIDLYPYRETLYAQGATAFIVLLLAPLHRILAPIKPLPRASYSPFIMNLYGWTRLLLVSLLLNLFVVYLSTHGLPSSMNRPRLADISLGSFNIVLTLPMIGAFTSGVAVASILYWPPRFRYVRWHFGVLRLLVATLCLMSVGLMYRNTANPEGFLNAIVIACVAMFVAIPVQRSLS
jgi:hypothetical protein